MQMQIMRKLLVPLAAPLLALTTLAALAPSASALTVTPPADTAGVTNIGWSVVGLDSNDVNVGPNEFPVGARYCATAAVTGVTATWSWLGTGTTADDSLIRLADTGTAYATTNVGNLAASGCYDAYWNVKLTRDVATYGKSRAYQVTFRDASGNLLGSTDNRRRIYAEHLISQDRNRAGAVSLVGGDTSTALVAGTTYNFIATGSTAASYGELTFATIFPAPAFRLLKAWYTYSTPIGVVDQTNADACSWVPVYDETGQPGQCSTDGKAGGNVVAHFTVQVAPNASGSFDLHTLIYDFSGSSFHYNNDFNAASNTFTVGAQPAHAVAINYFANAGTDTVTGTVPASASVLQGANYTIANSTLTRTDGTKSYAFVGWNTNATNTGNAYKAGDVITPMGDVNLYAVWVPVLHWALAYNLQGGVGDSTTSTVKVAIALPVNLGESITVSANVPTRAGYLFTGWNTAPNGSGTNYAAGVVIPDPNVETLVVLYAKWAAITPATTFPLTVLVVGSGTATPASGPYVAGSIVPVSAVPATGWLFNGWTGACTGTTPNCLVTMAGAETVTATFVQPVTVTTTVVGNGTVATSVPTGVGQLPGSAVTLTATPDAGWQFTNWTGSCTGSTNPVTIALDGSKSCAATFVKVAVAGPSAANDMFSMLSGATLRVSGAAGILVNDSSDITRVSALSKVKHGTMTLAANGNLVYKPFRGFVGTDSFRYTAFNAQGKSATATVKIVVKPSVPKTVTTGR